MLPKHTGKWGHLYPLFCELINICVCIWHYMAWVSPLKGFPTPYLTARRRSISECSLVKVKEKFRAEGEDLVPWIQQNELENSKVQDLSLPVLLLKQQSSEMTSLGPRERNRNSDIVLASVGRPVHTAQTIPPTTFGESTILGNPNNLWTHWLPDDLAGNNTAWKGFKLEGERKEKAKKTYRREGWQSCPYLSRPEFSHPCLGGSRVALKPGCGPQMQATPSTRWHTVVIYITIALGQIPPTRHRGAPLICSALSPALLDTLTVESLGFSKRRGTNGLQYGSHGWRPRQKFSLWEVHILFLDSNCGHLEKHKASDFIFFFFFLLV